MKKKKSKTTVFTYNLGPKGEKGKVVNATLGDYRTYFDTGMIPWDKDNPSEEAKAFLRFFGLNWLLPSKESE